MVIILLFCCLFLIAPPEPETCSEEDEERTEGDTVVLEPCPITSPVQRAELQFQWSIQNGNGEWAKIRPVGRFRVNLHGVLTISNVQPSDSGLYRVNISNNHGSALHRVKLEVTPQPVTGDDGKGQYLKHSCKAAQFSIDILK